MNTHLERPKTAEGHRHSGHGAPYEDEDALADLLTGSPRTRVPRSPLEAELETRQTSTQWPLQP